MGVRHLSSAIGAVAALGALAAGCTSHSGAGPTSTRLSIGSTVYQLSELSSPSGPAVSGPGAELTAVSTSSASAPLGMATPSVAGTSSDDVPTSDTPTGDPARSTAIPQGPASSSAVIPTEGLDPQEAADRQAVADMWVKFWDVFASIDSVPSEQRGAVVASVATPAFAQRIVESAAGYAAQNKMTYGYVLHRIFWGPPIEDGQTALVGDCMDTTNYGDANKATGSKETLGTAREYARGHLVRSPSGWLVDSYTFVDQPC